MDLDMADYGLDMERYAKLARWAVAEGCVLLENENGALPIKKGENIAVFGRSAFNYYKSGLGSGGMVNTRYTVSVLDALKNDKDVILNQELLEIYEDWIAQNPYDEGTGWGNVPWSQKEMPVTDRMLEIAKESAVSLVIIGRTAGEERDNDAVAGSFLLTKEEEALIEGVCRESDRSVIVLNTGNIIDMGWVRKYRPKAVIYVWQGGQEGGNGTLDVLMGRVNPSGKLTDTIAESIDDYPSTANFGSSTKNYYVEDIYVGYRYFETFAKDKVLYPFGYGLSYTTFDIRGEMTSVSEKDCVVKAWVKNTGVCAGKEVVQVYAKVPQGKLGNPTRKLVAFAKTKLLASGEEEEITLTIPKRELASYDDSGITGNKSCYVLEEGRYEIYIGTDVRSATLGGGFEQGFEVVERLEEEFAPTESFKRMKPCAKSYAKDVVVDINAADDELFDISMEEVPIKPYSYREKYERYKKEVDEIPFTGNKGYRLVDVLDKKISIEEFTAQLDDDDLINIFRGEGMCSPRVTAGTAAAFGGVTSSLEKFGIPAACCADGPSGIRMDCGSKAFSLPNGTALGASFNPDLNRELFRMLGRELRLNKIDALLGPGMNIHRNPLNGRNFEYISEDPYLTGKIAAAQVEAMEESQIAGTIKHFCANNQEKARRLSDSVVSERALREIYLKGFEIVVKSGHARSVMTTYGSVNGIWTAGNYDLCTRILRNEWGFKGIVMSDWWAEANYEGEPSAKEVKAPMSAAQNDLYMCVSDSAANPENDDMKRQLESGYITRGQLQRNAMNILGFILQSPAILRAEGRISEEEVQAGLAMESQSDAAVNLLYYEVDTDTQELIIDGSVLHPGAGKSDMFLISLNQSGNYSISIVLKSELGSLAQLPVSVFCGSILKATISIQGTEGRTIVEKRDLGFMIKELNNYVRLYYGANGIEIEKVIIKLEK